VEPARPGDVRDAGLVTPAWSASGVAGLALPALLIAIAAGLLGYARSVARRGWLA